MFQEADAIVSDIHWNSLDLNRKDSTYMNHRGFLYSTDIDLAHKVQEIFNDFGSIALSQDIFVNKPIMGLQSVLW